jgi:hypothetical protein
MLICITYEAGELIDQVVFPRSALEMRLNFHSLSALILYQDVANVEKTPKFK